MRNILRILSGMALAAGFAVGSPALAASTTWTGPGGTYSDGGNWSAGVPAAGDTALFLANGSPTFLTDVAGQLDSFQFDTGATSFVFNINSDLLEFDGAGVVDNSGGSNGFSLVFGGLTFTNSASIVNNSGITNDTIYAQGSSAVSFTDDSSAGNAIVTSDSSLVQFAANASASTATINLFNSSELDIYGSATAANATIDVNDSSLVVFAENASAASATIDADDSLLIFVDNASAANANIFVNNGSVAAFWYDSSAGSATIRLDNSLLEFDDNASAGSATITTISGPSPISFYSSSTAGAASISVTNASVLTFYDTSSGGTASLSSDADSIIDFSATAGPNNDKKVGFGSLSGSGTVWLGGNEVSIGGNNASTTFTGVIADCSDDCAANGEGLPVAPGKIVKTGTGTLTLTGENTYTGGTAINAGQITAGNNLALSTGAVSMADGAKLGFTGGGGFTLANSFTLTGTPIVTVGAGDTNTLSGAIGGSGKLEKQGNGTLVLSSSSNSYSGGTLVTAGTLRSGANNAFGAGPITVSSGANLNLAGFNQTVSGLSGSGVIILGSGTLTVSGNGDSAFGGNISGTGGLTKSGTGKLTLTGANSYTGMTIIAQGTLELGDGTTGGSIASGTISNAGTLAFNLPGNGSLNFTSVISGTGGVVKNGSNTLIFANTQTYTGPTALNAGTLTVNGSMASIVTVASGAILKGNGTVAGVVLNNGGKIAPGNSIGTLNVAGNANFAVGSIYQVEINTAGQADLINATGTATILGGTVQVDTSAGFNPNLTYTVVTAQGGVSGSFAGLTVDNPDLQAFLTYDAKNVYLRVFPKSFASGGEIHATLLTSLFADAMATRRTILTLTDRQDDDPDIYFWSHIDQHWDTAEAKGGASALAREYFSIMVGADKLVAPGWRLGLEAGYGQEDLEIAAVKSEALFNRGTVGAYFHGWAGPIRLHGGVSHMWGTVKTTRIVTYATVSDTTKSKQDVDSTQGFIEAGLPMAIGAFPFEPIAGLSWVNVGAGSAQETGGTSAMFVRDGDLDGFFSLLGAQSRKIVASDGGTIVTLFMRAAWQHDFRDDTVARKLTHTLTGTSFTILGLQPDRDRALIDFNATAAFDNNLSLSLGYMGAHSPHETDHALRADFGWKF